MLIAVAVMLSGVSFAVYYSHVSLPRKPPLLDWKDADVVARGETLYEDKCVSCHGAIGEARIPGEAAAIPSHGVDGHTWEHPDFALVQITKSGEVAELCRDVRDSDMPEFGQYLSDRQIVDVLSYIKSTWPEDIRTRHDDINRLYEGQNAAVRDLLDLSES